MKRKRSFEQDTPNKRQKISSSNGGKSLDNRAHLEGRLTLIKLASSADPELENSGPEAGPSEEWDSKDKGVLKKKDFKRMHLKESEYHRAGYIAWNRNLKASLRPNRDGIEESRAGWGRSGMGGQR